MAKVKRKSSATPKSIAAPDLDDMMARVSERIALPPVPMSFEYQADVDLLCIRFGEAVSSSLLDDDDELENGVIGIYDGKKLVGLEVLDLYGVFAS